MARINLDATTLPDFEQRIRAIQPSAARRWGTMSPAQMFAHLRITIEISLEEREARDESRPWLTPVLYCLLFELWTDWPKGVISASTQFLEPGAEDFAEERQHLIDALRRFVPRAEQEPERLTLEPMLGRVSLKKWRRIHGVHTDYHLRQFGA